MGQPRGRTIGKSEQLGVIQRKAYVRVAIATNQSVASISRTQDGVSLVEGDRVLLVGQTTPVQNSIWECRLLDATTAALFLADDVDDDDDLRTGCEVRVSSGTVYGGYVFSLPYGATVAGSKSWSGAPPSFPYFGAPVATLAALGLVAAADSADGQQRVVESDAQGRRSIWVKDTTSTVAVDGATVIAATGAGRWFKSHDVESGETKIKDSTAVGILASRCVRKVGWDSTDNCWTVALAEPTGSLEHPAGWLATALPPSGVGVMYETIENVQVDNDLTIPVVGTPLFLGPSGTLVLTAALPALPASQYVVGRVVQQSNPGRASFDFRRALNQLGTDRLRDLAVTTAKVADDAVTAAKLANGAVTNDKPAAAFAFLEDEGTPASAMIGFVVNPAPADTVTITVGGVPVVYEFGGAGPVPIPVVIGGTPDVTAGNLYAAIIANQDLIGDHAPGSPGFGVAVASKSAVVAGTTLALAKSAAEPATLQDNGEERARTATRIVPVRRTRTVMAAEVTIGTIFVHTRVSSFIDPPNVWFVEAATEAPVPWDGAITLSAADDGSRIIEVGQGTVNLWADGHRVKVDGIGASI